MILIDIEIGGDLFDIALSRYFVKLALSLLQNLLKLWRVVFVFVWYRLIDCLISIDIDIGFANIEGIV